MESTFVPEVSQAEYDFLKELVKREAGIVLNDNKKVLIKSRIGRRLRALNFEGWQPYLSLLSKKGNPELQFFINSMTTNKTEFFREKSHFESLAKLVEEKGPVSTLTAWIAASSTGQEAYTLAMVFEELKAKIGTFQYRILATDIDTDALATAERGVFAKEFVDRDVKPDILKKYFEKGVGANSEFYRIKSSLKKNIKFRQHNLTDSNIRVPLEFDVIFVRNVLIYFDNETIDQVISKLQQHLKPEGLLFTGHCETLSNLKCPLETIGHAIYRNKSPGSVKAVESPAVESQSIHREQTEVKSVLVVDDSKVVRKLLIALINEDPRLELFGEAEDPIEAEKLMSSRVPDVITLDINMPKMNGIEYLKQLMPKRNIPVVMISGMNDKDGDISLQSIELGAVDFIQKPELSKMSEFSLEIKEKIYGASLAKTKVFKEVAKYSKSIVPRKMRMESIIAIGSSTGGTAALSDFFQRFPNDIPPVLVVQHIPAHFSTLLAKRLDSQSAFTVKEAEDGDLVAKNMVLLAPGGKHMILKRDKDDKLYVSVKAGTPVNNHMPSVDALFDSVAEIVGSKSVGVILTGMGRDGAQGLLKLKNSGAYTIAQDEESCVVFGMPREAIQLGAASDVAPLSKCPDLVVNHLSKPKRMDIDDTNISSGRRRRSA